MTDIIKVTTAPASTIRVGYVGSTAAEVSYTPTGISGRITDTNVQDAITSLDAKIVAATVVVDTTIIDGSGNAVTGNAVHDALALKQDVANILTSTSLTGASDTNYPSALAIKTYVDTATTYDTVPTNGSTNAVMSDGVFDALALKQSIANLSTDGTFATPGNIEYPSTQAVVTYVASAVAAGVTFGDATAAAIDATGSGGSATSAARSDHRHAAQGVSADAGNSLTVGLDGLHFYDASLKADLASPAFTGTPTAPTATAGTNTTQLATTAFVAAAVVTNLDGLSDVVLTAPSTGQVLQYNGTSWVNAAISGLALDDLSDVVVTTPTAGDFLQYDGTQWLNAPPSLAAAGLVQQVQYNNSGNLAGAANVHVISDNLGLGVLTADPATPASDLVLYNRSIGMPMLHSIDSVGVVSEYQKWIGNRQYTVWRPSATTTINADGTPATTVGTVSTPAIATTSRVAAMRRTQLQSAAVANSAGEAYSTQFLVWRGNAAGLGGWCFTCRFAIVTIPANFRFFVGLTNSVAAIAATSDMMTTANTIGVGCQSGDTNLRRQIFGTPALTGTDLGVNFPRNNTTAYFLTIYAAPNGADVTLRLLNESTGNVSEITQTTQLPTNTTLLSPHIWCSNGGTAAAAAIAFGHMCLESNY